MKNIATTWSESTIGITRGNLLHLDGTWALERTVFEALEDGGRWWVAVRGEIHDVVAVFLLVDVNLTQIVVHQLPRWPRPDRTVTLHCYKSLGTHSKITSNPYTIIAAPIVPFTRRVRFRESFRQSRPTVNPEPSFSKFVEHHGPILLRLQLLKRDTELHLRRKLATIDGDNNYRSNKSNNLL